jgi:RimJ/RimL family protein N-acetyltransferase
VQLSCVEANVFVFTGEHCSMVELCEANEFDLFQLISRNAIEYQTLVSCQALASDFQKFQQQLTRWFESGRRYQFLVLRNDGSVTGTIFFISVGDASSTDISCFFEPCVRGSRLIGESLTSACRFARHIMQVRELGFRVYPENLKMLNLARRLRCTYLGMVPSLSNPDRRNHRFLVSDELIAMMNDYFPIPAI